MQLEHSFTVPVGVDKAWEALLDIEQVAPCMPGAVLESVDGDDFTGSVKVKLGPIGLTYKGNASFIEKDADAHRAVIDARGKDSRGNGTAAAKVTATLLADGDDSTKVEVITDLNITGKPAQFGRGVMADVGNKLIGQFADCLAGKLAGSPEPVDAPEPAAAPAEPTPAANADAAVDGVEPATAEPATAEPIAAEPAAAEAAEPAPKPAAATPAARRPSVEEVEPIDLVASAGPAVVKRLAPVGVAAIVAILLLLVLRRRKHR